MYADALDMKTCGNSVFHDCQAMHGGNILQSYPHQDAVECSQSEWDCAVKGFRSVKNTYKLFL